MLHLADIPRLDEPATVLGLMVLVTVQCKCGAANALVLVGDQPTFCASCGTGHAVDAVTWSKDVAVPKIALSVSPRMVS